MVLLRLVRMYLWYVLVTFGVAAVAVVLGTVIPGPMALFVGFLLVFAIAFVGIVWHARFR